MKKRKPDNSPPPHLTSAWAASLARQYLRGDGRLTEVHVRALAQFALDVYAALRPQTSRYDIAAEAQERQRNAARAVGQRRREIRVVGQQGRKS
jgi:hypothetical protein